MAQDVATLLKKYAEFRELVRITDSLPDPDPAVSMLRQGFAECYDALQVTWIPCQERMPDTSRYVWVGIPDALLGIQKRVQGVWVWGFAYGDTCTPPRLWAEIAWPEPPAG